MTQTKKRTLKSARTDTHERAVIKKSSIDIEFLSVVIILLTFGLIMVFSASYPSANYKYGDGLYFIKKQAIWAVLGFAAMVITMKIDYRVYKKFALPIGFVTLVLLGMVFIFPAYNGAHRWIGIGSLSFQPSEMAKIAVIIYLAASLSVVKDKIRDFSVLIKHLVMVGIVLGLLYVEPHLSVCIIIAIVAFIMLMVSGARFKQFMGLGLLGLPVVGYLAVKEGYRMDRIVTFFDPFQDRLGDGWQIIQSLYAIGSGGLFGLGFGNSRQKYMYVSEPQNDFIFAIICEELGIIGAAVIIALFAILIWRGMKIAMNAPDLFGSLLVTGIVSLVGVQTFLNIAVVTKMIPTTGISLPFFSAGGSSLVFLMAAMGMVLNVSKYKKQVVDLW
ncbi:MAG: putative lipid II flippase FtsW [Clostridia bacterium]|nr:putative lipid II flippase FtsW [Clostridia bacterium]